MKLSQFHVYKAETQSEYTIQKYENVFFLFTFSIDLLYLDIFERFYINNISINVTLHQFSMHHHIFGMLCHFTAI